MTHTAYLISETEVGNPDTGFSTVYVYKDTIAKIEAQMAFWISQYCKVNRVIDGLNATLTVVTPETLQWKDTFHIRTEFEQKPIWAVPSIQALFADNGMGGLPYARRVVMAATTQPLYSALSPVPTGFTDNVVLSDTLSGNTVERTLTDNEKILYNLIMRNVRGVPIKQYCLMRRRIIPRSATTLMKTQDGLMVYTTAQLEEKYAFPDEARNLISEIDTSPQLPSANDNWKWGWWERDMDRECQMGTGKVRESYGWVWGCWPIPPYIAYTTP